MNYIELFKKSCAEVPKKTAIVDQDGTRETTYAELNRLSSLAAGKFHALGCKKGDFIVIQMSRCMEYLAAYFGALKAGCAVVPTVPAYPQERINTICQDCNAAALVKDDFFTDITNYAPYEDLAEDNLPALLVYTSGSTGTPKGVLHSVKGLCYGVLNQMEHHRTLNPLIFAGFGNFSFISHVVEFLGVLAAQGTVHILSPEVKASAQKLIDYYARHNITCGFIPPQLLYLIKDGSLHPKRIHTGGEKLCNASIPGVEILNFYAQTETCGPVTIFAVNRDYDNTPVGKEIGGTVITICDENDCEVTKGQIGEIRVTGPFDVSYYKQPEQSAKTFRKLPDGRITICTGDLGYRDENGNVVCLGRKDWMLKINGQRVEPGEIAAVIRKIPHITNAAVKGFEKQHGKILLCAYYTADAPVSAAAIKSYLGNELPIYMIPTYFVQLDALPVNQNGKLDRLALKEPETERNIDPPETEGQKRICEAMQTVLNLEQVGIHEDFFELGGDSISCTQLLLLLNDTDLDAAKVYRLHTPEKLAEVLFDNEHENMEQANKLARLQEQPLLPYQVFYLNWTLYSPNKATANCPVNFRLPIGSVEPTALQRAIDTVLHHYAAYGTIFTRNADGQTVQHYHPELIEPIPIINTTEKNYQENIQRQFIRPFPPFDALQYRIQICLTEKACYLMLDINHTITDGFSIMNTLKSIFDSLQGKSLPADNYYLYLQRWNDNTRSEQWRNEETELAQLYHREGYARLPKFDFESSENTHLRLYVPSKLPFSAYSEAIEKKNLSMSTVLITAGLLALSRYNNNPKAEVQWIYHGRDEGWKQDLVGITMCAISTAVDLDEIPDTDALLAEVRRQAVIGIHYADHSFAVNNFRPVSNDYLRVINEDAVDMEGNILPTGTKTENAFEIKTACDYTCQFLFFPPKNPSEPLVVVITANGALYRKESMQKFGELILQSINECLF